ncbi:MAG TPA: hypothetical protein VHY84_27195 [Bryobacteraceae bacterium]|jgi:hypothetical protein|nr:hypothetical protein [Bryobacteraceae bacterium]
MAAGASSILLASTGACERYRYRCGAKLQSTLGRRQRESARATRSGHSDFLLQSQNYPFNAAQTLGMPGQTAARTFPIISTNGVGVTQPANTTKGGLSTIGGSFDQHFLERRPSLNLSTTYVRGSHSYKAGFEIRQMKYPNYNWSGSAGTYYTVITSVR